MDSALRGRKIFAEFGRARKQFAERNPFYGLRENNRLNTNYPDRIIL
jgi:hypothetical protein